MAETFSEKITNVWNLYQMLSFFPSPSLSGLTIEGIYRKPGKAVDVEDVINKVDKGQKLQIFIET